MKEKYLKSDRKENRHLLLYLATTIEIGAGFNKVNLDQEK